MAESRPGIPKRIQNPLSQAGDGLLANPAATASGRHDLSFLQPAQSADELGRLGGYRVLKVLGEGGMGLVLQAHDPGLDRIVAIKVMHPRQAQNARSKQRFLVEARAVAKVAHEHIVPIFQVGEENGLPFIAMAFLEGETLGQRIKRQTPFPWQEAARITREVAEGLAAAHAKGLIHRDIKPANIWLDTPESAKNPARARILDFGLVRNTKDSTRVTQLGAILGTPAYMSPEQAMSEEVDERTDLFSLGVILYEMCTGKRPFPGQSVVEIMSAIAADTPKSIRELNPQIPEGLAQLAVKLLEKDREKRVKSAEHLVHAIELVERDAAHSFARKENSAAEKPVSNAFAFNEPTPRVPGVSRRELAPTETYAATPTPRAKTAVRRGVPMWFWFAGATLLATLVVTLIVMFRGPTAVVNNDKLEPKNNGAAVKPPPEQKAKPAPPVAGATPKAGDVITNSIGMKLAYIPAGKFLMGSPTSDTAARDDEKPQHQVDITKAFYLGMFEVTQEEYESVTGKNPSASKDNRRKPVETVSWQDAKDFCRDLSKKEGKTYRLPTEAEWEYACRGGTTTKYHTGDTLAATKANFGWSEIREVGQYQANSFGLHDMHGNAGEWCEDWYSETAYTVGDQSNPSGPLTGEKRVQRGGGLLGSSVNCRSANRSGIDPSSKRNFIGFRVVLEVVGGETEPPPSPVVPKTEIAKAPQATDKSGKDGFVPLFNGVDLTGWRLDKNTGKWRVEDGNLIGYAGNPQSDLYTVRNDFKNFHLRAEAMINANGLAGIHVRVPVGKAVPYWPGYQTFINVNNKFPHKTGSVVVAGRPGGTVVSQSKISTGEWFTFEIIAQDNRISTRVNQFPIANYADPNRTYDVGSISLFQFGTHTVVKYRKIEVRAFSP